MNFSIIIASVFLFGTAYAQGGLEEEKKLSGEYLARVKAEPGTIEVEDGVLIRAISTSSNKQQPVLSDNIEVIYHGFDREGFVFDSNFEREETNVFPLNGLIKCWQIALPKISIGSFFKISCPSDTAYGDKGAGDGLIKPGAAISFRVMLLNITSN